jgi:hypothetical protein
MRNIFSFYVRTDLNCGAPILIQLFHNIFLDRKKPVVPFHLVDIYRPQIKKVAAIIF